METISSEIKRLEKQCAEYKDMYERMADEATSLEARLEQEMKISGMYRQWFARNAHWTQRHNNMMKYDPELGNYKRRGASEEIIIEPPIIWEKVPGTTVKGKLSTVDLDTEEE